MNSSCFFLLYFFFFFNDTATTEIYTLSLHDALPISSPRSCPRHSRFRSSLGGTRVTARPRMRRCAAEKPHHRDRRLLRARRERPRGRAAEQPDEIAPFHCQCFPCFRCKG